MTDGEKIKMLIQSLSNTGGVSTIVAVVKEVDEEKAVITVDIGEGLLIDEVRLRSIVDNDQGFYVIPKLESKVLILSIGSADDFVAVAFEQYDKVVCRGETISFVVSQENITFNDNRLDSFLTDINKLTEKLNKIEQEINNVKAVFRNWTPVIQDGGAKLKLGITTWAATDITETTVDDIKDDKILN